MYPKKTDEIQLLKAHWLDTAKRSERDCCPCFTCFHPIEDIMLADEIAHSVGVQCVPWGGTEDTSRVMLCFTPEWIPVHPDDFPIQCLSFFFHGSALPPKHRDFLGALMACNLKRDTIGDILIDLEMAQAFVCSHVSAVILQEVQHVGQIGVQVREDTAACLSAKKAFSILQGTVASFRADVIVAFAVRCSREKAVQLIRQGRLFCRHTTIETPSAVLQIGDVFSIRGFGKFRFSEADGITRKGRYHITIQKYQG